MRSDPDARYDDVVRLRGEDIEPMVTWGITPAQSTPVGAALPAPEQFPDAERPLISEAYQYMQLEPGKPLRGTKIDVAFIGSPPNGRATDFEAGGGPRPGGRPPLPTPPQARVVARGAPGRPGVGPLRPGPNPP